MTLLFYPDASDWVGRIRLGPRGFSVTEAALSGTLAMSRVTVEDDAADLSIVGHHAFKVVETACSWGTLFRGWFADRDVARGDESGRTGASRVWDATIMDANAALQFEVIRGSTARRPAETDTQRLAWLLASSYKGPISSSDANVLGYGVALDRADYRGMTAADVLADCGGASGANYFVSWDDAAGEHRLHYYRPTRAFNESTIKVSNVLSDVDGTTVLAPSRDTRLSRDPERVFSGVYYRYGERDSAVFEESATVLAAIGHRREAAEQDASVRTAAKASAKAQRWLAEAETELDTIVTTIPRVPPAQVNLIRAGQRVQVRFSHLPGYSSYTWMRVTRRTVEQDGETQEYYRLTLELSDPKQVGARVRHRPAPVEPDVADGSAVSLGHYCLTVGRDQDDGHGGATDTFAFAGPGGPIHDTVTSAVAYGIPYIFASCPFGQSGYSGFTHEEQWFAFTLGTLTDQLGVRVTMTIDGTEGVVGARGLEFGVGYATPTDIRQYTVLGSTGDLAAGDVISFLIPRPMLVAAEMFAVIAPAWDCDRGVFACSGSFGGGVPLDHGAFESGRCGLDPVTAVTVVSSGETGVTSWLPVVGVVDGSNRTFSLDDWSGRGTPRVSINGIELTRGEDYSYDADALTITLGTAPWAGADVRARYVA